MGEPVLCLGCGGVVDTGGAALFATRACSCPPPSVAPHTRAHPALVLVCPRCQGSLVEKRYADLDVDECAGCSGFFVPPAMMDRIVAAHDTRVALRLAVPARPFVREVEFHYLHCPGCQKLMNRKVFARISGVIVDVCREHGVWFDPGKLTMVLAFIEHGGLEKAKQHDAEEQAQAARDAKAAHLREQMRDALVAGHFRWQHQMNPGAAHDLLWALADLWR